MPRPGTLLFNFTGSGSEQDATASKALSDAGNRESVDDIYTRVIFQFVAPVTSPSAATTAEDTLTTLPPPVTTAKFPLSPFTVIARIAGIRLIRRESPFLSEIQYFPFRPGTLYDVIPVTVRQIFPFTS
jgi:hypothetical protein